ncbi:hypothetical protein CAC02_04555 [Streptococcus gallolyticus]|uniref:Uncharacterized protein n=1 Tax=Streptococcus gallolyticus TaxID=315405 RepID=A0A368UDW1_9STRE|nr:hypothetical protein [Streptococcus gallolyticus]RCW17135.1 hypothetical protein CAC02_04555 [Streptococcus gallolyticus]
MTKLVYGKNKQVTFESELEKQEAIRYLRDSENITHADEQNQGAWANEKRFMIIFDVPQMPIGVRKNLTAGNRSYYGRINCGELFDEIFSD